MNKVDITLIGQVRDYKALKAFEEELNELETKFGGIKNLERLPDAIFVLEMKKDILAVKEAKMKGIKEFMDQGALLGHLWMEGYFEVGDPLIASGGHKLGKPIPGNERVEV